MQTISLEKFKELHSIHKEYVSQIGQDLFLDLFVFNKKQNGFFVDIGANDGVTLSNTYFFEKNRNWKGICVEPQPDCFQMLKATRAESTIKIKGCISELNGETEFIKVHGASQMLSCLKDYCSENHMQRIKREVAEIGGRIEMIPINNININELLGCLDVSKVDFLSIDTEGGEYNILEMIDFSRVHINAIAVEVNDNGEKIHNLMLSKNFKLAANLFGQDLIYINNNLILI